MDGCVGEWLCKIKLCETKMCEKTRSLNGWMGGWMDGWMGTKAGNVNCQTCKNSFDAKKTRAPEGRVEGWMDGWLSLKQSKTTKYGMKALSTNRAATFYQVVLLHLA